MDNDEQSNLLRWKGSEAISRRWAKRAEIVGKMIPPNASLLDIGCGNQILNEFLLKSVKYTPADIIPRSEDTIILDINKGIWPTGKWDYITACGVLEYINDLNPFFKNTSTLAKNLILTYHVSHNRQSVDRKRRRAQLGWLSNYSLNEIIRMGDKYHWITQSITSPSPKIYFSQYFIHFTVNE